MSVCEASRLFTTSEAAEVLGLRKSTLETWRCRGGGPRFVRLGAAIRYDQRDLERFIDAGRRASTSDPGEVAA